MKPSYGLAGFHPHVSKERFAEEMSPTLNLRADEQASSRGAIEIGAIVEDCRLIAELGYGSSGRVFLAQEISLGDRPIVLKIATANHDEHINLARLQHTHIMPLFWARMISPHGLRALAMPYLAKTTLADLMRGLERTPFTTWTGESVFEALEMDQSGLPVRIVAEEQPAKNLKNLSWVEFVVNLGRTLAEALAYAHQRNLLHLDIKAANIVLTPDGQPILLDLDVAHSPLAEGDTVVPWIGGTPAFMSPEQAAAMTAVRKNQPIARPVDGRSDLYSLGLVLYHALVGNCDHSLRPDPHNLPCLNPNVSRGLAGILARCLAENPNDRYPDCNALAEDLDRHLRDLPLQSIPNRLSERWRKWRRRRPFGLPILTLLVSFCIASSLAGINFMHVNDERRTQAESALVEGQEWQRKGQFEAAANRFLVGKELAETAYGTKHLRDQLALRLQNALRLQAADELNKTIHLMRFYALQEQTPRPLQHVFEAAGRKIWEKRILLTDRSAGDLPPDVEKKIESQLQEMLLLWFDLQLSLAPPTHKEPVRAEVRKVLEQADAVFGSTFSLKLARARNLDQSILAERQHPREAWEFCALGRVALANGEVDLANRYFEQAVDREPLGFASNLHSGVGLMRQKKYAEATHRLSFCLSINPSAECLMLRGEVHAALGNLDQALRDFSLALEKNPTLSMAYQHRSGILATLGRREDAARDLELAHKLPD